MQQGMPNNVSSPKFRVEPFSSHGGIGLVAHVKTKSRWKR